METTCMEEEFVKTLNFIKIYELDPETILSPPGLAWQTALKNTGVKAELLIHIDMLLMAEK